MASTTQEKVYVGARVDADVRDRLKVIAAQEGRSVSAEVARLILIHIKHQSPDRALEDLLA